MKLVEMYEADELEANNFDADGNIKIGYVGAFPYAEVISGYTSFFLGAQSIVEEETDISISMEVTYTSSWFNESLEREGANNLINRGAALISQHADSMGAPSACETAGVPNVSYNGSTEAACPNTFIVSSYVNWEPYFEYMIDCVMNGEEIVADWTGTLATGSVALADIGGAAAKGTAEKIEEVKAELEAGTLHVFDCSKFTVTKTENKNVNVTVDENGHLTSYMADVNDDGKYVADTQVVENGVFMESKHRSAPYFDLIIDGITTLNN
jgi:basic membrane protein A